MRYYFRRTKQEYCIVTKDPVQILDPVTDTEYYKVQNITPSMKSRGQPRGDKSNRQCEPAPFLANDINYIISPISALQKML
jgi:hypothetical protein